MYTSITFYNHYHNGDLFVTKKFVQSLIAQCPELTFDYCHLNHEKTTKDFGVTHIPSVDGLIDKMKFMSYESHLAINTWIGAYGAPGTDPPYFCRGGINLIDLHTIWNYIFQNVGSLLNKQLVLSNNIVDFIPSIDYSQFDIYSVDEFAKHHSNIVLFSNGKPMSGQSFDYDFREVVEMFASRYTHIAFVCTTKFQTEVRNIYFTDDIIDIESGFENNNQFWNQNLTRNDLAEISYLSRFSKLVVGKNSGPFIYCLTQENLLDPSKTFISFNTSNIDNLFYNIPTPAAYIQDSTTDINKIIQLIDSKLCLL